MNPVLKNILAVLAGIVIGGMVNMGLILLSNAVIPLPEGVNPADVESLQANMHLFEPKHFIFPFLAHALGTLIGAFIAARFAVNHAMKLAIGIGVFFLIGGSINAMSLPVPTWFSALDLIVAYIPMAWLGGKIVKGKDIAA